MILPRGCLIFSAGTSERVFMMSPRGCLVFIAGTSERVL